MSKHKTNDEFRSYIKTRLNFFKKDSYLTHQEISDFIGQTRSNVSNIICKKSKALPSIETIPLWCKALGITPNTLFGWYECYTDKIKPNKVEEDLLHVAIAIGDAKFEIEDVEGMEDLKDCLDIAENYLEKARGDLDEQNNTRNR